MNSNVGTPQNVEVFQLLSFTYRGKKGCTPEEEADLVKFICKVDINNVHNRKAAYTFEQTDPSDIKTRHMHGIIMVKKARTATGDMTRALKSIAQMYPGNRPDVTVKVKPCYQGKLKDTVGSEYANYIEYMEKHGPIAFNSLPADWEKYLLPDIPIDDRRKKSCSPDIDHCIELLRKKELRTDNVFCVAEGIFTLYKEGEFGLRKTCNERDLFAVDVYCKLNPHVTYYEARDLCGQLKQIKSYRETDDGHFDIEWLPSKKPKYDFNYI